MDKYIKIAKVILFVQLLTVMVVFGPTFLPASINFLQLLSLTIGPVILLIPFALLLAVSFIALFYTFVLPFLVLAIRNKPISIEENKISSIHLFFLFSPLVSIVAAILLHFTLSPPQISCPTLAVTGVKTIFTYGTARYFVLSIVAIPIFISFLSSAGLLILRKRIGRNTTLLSLMVIIIYLLTAPILFSITFASLNSTRPKSADARRISDIKQTQLALELYFDQFHSYPMVRGETSDGRWNELRNFLIPKFISRLVDDPCINVSRSYQYDYKNSPDGRSYVMRAILNDAKNSVLNSDMDGKVFNVWCGNQGEEQEYCVGSK